VPDIGLKLGDNAITVAYVWNGAAGPESNAVTVTRDGSAPSVDVVSPIDGSTTSGSQATVAGRAETGSTVRVKNVTVGSAANAETDTDGSFSASMVLVNGDNKLTVTATDTAGNETTVTRTVTRDPKASDLELELSHSSIQLANLPVALQITATLTNGTGTSDDGASVTFSLSPPGVPTSTYQGTIQSEQATWTPQVPTGASLGGGFATAKVTLANGKIVTGTALFNVR
jgi:bacillopeptidase F